MNATKRRIFVVAFLTGLALSAALSSAASPERAGLLPQSARNVQSRTFSKSAPLVVRVAPEDRKDAGRHHHLGLGKERGFRPRP